MQNKKTQKSEPVHLLYEATLESTYENAYVPVGHQIPARLDSGHCHKPPKTRMVEGGREGGREGGKEGGREGWREDKIE